MCIPSSTQCVRIVGFMHVCAAQYKAENAKVSDYLGTEQLGIKADVYSSELKSGVLIFILCNPIRVKKRHMKVKESLSILSPFFPGKRGSPETHTQLKEKREKVEFQSEWKKG